MDYSQVIMRMRVLGSQQKNSLAAKKTAQERSRWASRGRRPDTAGRRAIGTHRGWISGWTWQKTAEGNRREDRLNLFGADRVQA
jgi:hypothetical protein